MRRLFGLFGAGLGGALLGVLVMVASQRVGSSDASDGAARQPTTTTRPAKVAPLPTARADVLLTWTPESLDPALGAAARAMPDVDAVSQVSAGITNLASSRDGDGAVVDRPDDGWYIPLDTIAIEPSDHAKFASVADRAAVSELGNGEALLGRTSAQLRRLDVGGTLRFSNGVTLTVTGIVEDATIGAAELAVNRSTGAQLGVTNPRYLLVAHHSDRAAVETALRSVLPGGAPVRFRGQGETPYLRQGDAVLPHVKLKERFGEFAYKPPAPGSGSRDFQQDPAWQSANLVTRTMPLVGRVTCHRAVADAIEGALTELAQANLGNLVNPQDFAGCWNPRLVTAGGDLSHHAWGVALDINYQANQTGRESVQDQRLVATFERWGFTWGGEWLVSDPAHFEYLQPPRS